MRRIPRGFTIIELLVVVAVIGILATITLIGFNRYQADTRDSQRSSQATIISEALEKYYDKNGEYPSCSALTNPSGPSVISNTLVGTDPKVLVTPQAAASKTNSIDFCTDITTSTPTDSFAYVGDGSSVCSTGNSCLQFKIEYKEESTGTIKTINSRRQTGLLTSGNIADLSATTYSFSQVNLGWSAIGGATAYNIQYATNSAFTGATSVVPSPTTNSASVTGLTLGTLYYFRVQPTNSSTTGNWSNTASATTYTLDTPTGSAVADPANPASQIIFTWNTVPNATSYTVDYANNSSFTSPTTSTNATSPKTVTGLAAGTTLYFRVKSVAAGYTSGWSATTSAITQIPAPSCTSSTVNSNTQITVSWGSVAAATSYSLDYANNSGFTGATSIAGIATTSSAVSGLNNGTTYYFRVKAVNGSNSSAWGACPSATTGVNGPTSAGYSNGGCCTVRPVAGYYQWVGNNVDGLSGNYYSAQVSTYGSCGGGATFQVYMDAWYAYSSGSSPNTYSAEEDQGNREWWMVNGSNSWYVFYNAKVRCIINGQASGYYSIGTVGGY